MRLGLGLCLALASTTALNWGYFAQHGAASSLPPLELRRPLASLRRLIANRRWLAGFLVGVAGWGLYVAALGLAPLSLVQATSAGGIGVLALLVHLGSHGEGLGRRDWVAVAVAVAGLALLAASLVSQAPASRTTPGTDVAAWLLAAVLVAALTIGSIRLEAPPGAALGLAAGILYATGDIATKATVDTRGLVFAPAIFAAHGAAFVCLQFGFQRGNALVTVGLATLLTNALPIAAGTLLFHELLPGGVLGGCRIVAFALVTAGAAMLARGGPSATPAPATVLESAL